MKATKSPAVIVPDIVSRPPKTSTSSMLEFAMKPGHREKRPVDKRQLEIVSYVSFAHLGKAQRLKLFLVVGFYQTIEDSVERTNSVRRENCSWTFLNLPCRRDESVLVKKASMGIGARAMTVRSG